jgi:hypothetical protein
VTRREHGEKSWLKIRESIPIRLEKEEEDGPGDTISSQELVHDRWRSISHQRRGCMGEGRPALVWRWDVENQLDPLKEVQIKWSKNILVWEEEAVRSRERDRDRERERHRERDRETETDREKKGGGEIRDLGNELIQIGVERRPGLSISSITLTKLLIFGVTSSPFVSISESLSRIRWLRRDSEDMERGIVDGPSIASRFCSIATLFAVKIPLPDGIASKVQEIGEERLAAVEVIGWEESLGSTFSPPSPSLVPVNPSHQVRWLEVEAVIRHGVSECVQVTW